MKTSKIDIFETRLLPEKVEEYRQQRRKKATQDPAIISEFEDLVCQLYEKGWTTQKICIKFVIAFDTLVKILRKHNVTVRHPNSTKTFPKKITHSWDADGKTYNIRNMNCPAQFVLALNNEREIVRLIGKVGVPVLWTHVFDCIIKKNGEYFGVEIKTVSRKSRGSAKNRFTVHYYVHLRQMETAKAFGWKRILFLSITNSDKNGIFVIPDCEWMDEIVLRKGPGFGKKKVVTIFYKPQLERAIPFDQWLKEVSA